MAQRPRSGRRTRACAGVLAALLALTVTVAVPSTAATHRHHHHHPGAHAQAVLAATTSGTLHGVAKFDGQAVTGRAAGGAAARGGLPVAATSTRAAVSAAMYTRPVRGPPGDDVT